VNLFIWPSFPLFDKDKIHSRKKTVDLCK
jgi:hypothetical protein